jgi:hypothetical protein
VPAPLIAIIDAYCERYHALPYRVEADLRDPAKADSFWRTVDMWAVEAANPPPKSRR